ncbi:bacteriocin immunity protein [Streptomyces sp. NPDC059994]|uniref:bacteriocin immunity protein n=1 Tax=Streptomyces sp. NPDC059994 TaxID=3347029 RepID=UPI00369561AA
MTRQSSRAGTLAQDELVDLVQRIMDGEGTEDEHDALVETLERNVPHPRVSDLIYYPGNEGYDRELTAHQVVEAALAYRPIALWQGRHPTP